MDGDDPRPFVVAFHGEGLCTTVDLYRQMMMLMLMVANKQIVFRKTFIEQLLAEHYAKHETTAN